MPPYLFQQYIFRTLQKIVVPGHYIYFFVFIAIYPRFVALCEFIVCFLKGIESLGMILSESFIKEISE